MKINKFYAAALAATVLLASCAKENPNDGNNQVGGDTYAGISIVLEDQNTRAVGTETGTTQESLISSIKVFITDNDDNTMQTATFAYPGDFDISGEYKKANAAILTTAGNKTVYVVANPTASLNALLTTSAAVKSNVLSLAETGYYTGSFTGAPGSLTNLVLSGRSASTTLAVQDAAAALDAPVQVDLTRNVAKISVKQAATVPVTGGSVADLAFGLAAKVNKSYLTAQTNTALYEVPASPDAAYFSDNFSSRTGLTYVAVNGNGVAINSANAWFALEHKPNAWHEGNSTKIVVRATFTPTPNTSVTGYADGKVTVGSITGGQSFYVEKETQYIWSTGAYAQAIASTDFDADDFSDIYTNGVGYYQVNIKSGAEPGVRGVIRNNIYELTITSITGPGDPTEDGGGDPEDPNQEESNIAVSIKTIPWTYNTWGEGLQ